MKRVNLHLTDNQIKKLKELSRKNGLSVAELVRRAVDAYLEYEKSLKQENICPKCGSKKINKKDYEDEMYLLR